MAMYFQFIKSVFLKEYFDFHSSDINMFKYHPQLRFMLGINGVFGNYGSKFRYIFPFTNLAALLGISVYQMMIIYHGLDVGDNSLAIECFLYVMMFITTASTVICFMYNKDDLLRLIDKLNDEFVNICSLKTKYKDIFMDGQFLIWKLSVVWFTSMIAFGVVYIINTIVMLLYYSLIATRTEDSVRPIMAPVWLPNGDPFRTPNYEILFAVYCYIILIIPFTQGVYLYLIFHIFLHIYYTMDMVILDFEVIFEDVNECVALLSRRDPIRMEAQAILNKRIKRIVTWHTSILESMKTISSVFAVPLIFQLTVSSVVFICISAYQVSEQLNHGNFDYLFAVLSVIMCVQLWIPCYLGSLIEYKGFAISDACWNCGWQETRLGTMMRNDIIILLKSFQRPITIKFTGVPRLGLETFTSIMTTAYTYFNMLRQYS